MPKIESLLTGFPLLVLDRRATALEAARAMTERKVGSTMIVDAGGRPTGVFTERDLMSRVIAAGLDPARVRLEEVMTTKLFVARSDDEIARVELELQRHHVRHLPVVDAQGRLIATLSARDLLRRHLTEAKNELKALHEYIGTPENHDASDEPSP